MDEANEAPPGWYADPSGSGTKRWWDGGAWTDEVAHSRWTPATAPVAVSTPVAGAARRRSSDRHHWLQAAGRIAALAVLVPLGIWLIPRVVTGPEAARHLTPPDPTTRVPTVPVAPTVVQRALLSIGQITLLAPDGSGAEGSGWIARPGIVFTNNHVIADDPDLPIRFITPDGTASTCRVIAADPKGDIAELGCPTGNHPPLPMRNDVPPVGTTAIVIGYPLGVGPKVTNGAVTDLETGVQSGIHPIHTSAEVHPGNSGGPMLDDQGRVFAMTTWGDSTTADGVRVGEARDLMSTGDTFATLHMKNRALLWQLTVTLGLVGFAVGGWTKWRSGTGRPWTRAIGLAVALALLGLGIGGARIVLTEPRGTPEPQAAGGPR